MQNDPYAPPSAEVADAVPPPKGSPPRPVAIAVRLLWLSLFLGVPSLVLVVLRSPSGTATSVGVVLQLALFALAAYLNVCIHRGKNWARVISLIFTLIGLMFLAFIPSPSDVSVIEWLLAVASAALDVVAMYLLFSKPGSSWFKSASQ